MFYNFDNIFTLFLCKINVFRCDYYFLGVNHFGKYLKFSLIVKVTFCWECTCKASLIYAETMLKILEIFCNLRGLYPDIRVPGNLDFIQWMHIWYKNEQKFLMISVEKKYIWRVIQKRILYFEVELLIAYFQGRVKL